MSGKKREGRDPLIVSNILLLPVYHGFMEFGVAVRNELLAFEPEAIAVELPPSLEALVRKGVLRLPYLSVVVSNGGNGHHGYLIIEPQEPLIEAVRHGVERNLPVHFIDREMHDYPEHRDPVPDPSTVSVVGLRALAQAYLSAAGSSLPAPESPDGLREQTMAYNLAVASEGGKVRLAAVFGMAHLPGVLHHLKDPVAPPLAKRPRSSAHLANLHRDSSREILSDVPFLITAYEVMRGVKIPEAEAGAAAQGKVLSFTGRPAPPHRKRVEDIFDEGLQPDLSAEMWAEEEPAPAAPAAAAEALPDPRQRSYVLDRSRLHIDLVRLAAARHKSKNGEELTRTRIRDLFKFARNWALVEGGLVPDFYQLCIAARSLADDDFAYEVWDLGSDYPWQDESPSLPTVKLSAEDLARGIRRIRFRRKIKSLRRHLVPIRKRRREQFPGEWKEEWKGVSICSHPPEDILIEGFGEYLRKKAVKMIAEEQSRVEPFTTSLLDGIDMRETIRNWHEKRIYVRENRHIAGKAGSLVMIFDPDEPPQGADPKRWEEQYPYRMTWHGEHNQESDLACYATEPGEHLAGPGISKCLYGGLMMTYPPRRVFDIWRDPFFSTIESKPQRLLAAAIDYCLEKFIVYVAAKPPRSWLKTMAERMGKKVVYVPIGQLSPVTVKKIRAFHILDGYHVRQYAKDYIW